MTGVLDTADGPTILAHTDRMKLREANILKKDKRHSKGKEKMRKLQGSDKLPHQTSTANRLKCVNEKKNDHPQGKQYHAPTEMDSTNRDSGSRPPRRDRHARKASNNNANARMARLPQHTHLPLANRHCTRAHSTNCHSPAGPRETSPPGSRHTMPIGPKFEEWICWSIMNISGWGFAGRVNLQGGASIHSLLSASWTHN